MFFKMTNTALAAMTYARQWDLLDYAAGRLDRFRSVAAVTPPDLVEADRRARLEAAMRDQTGMNIIAFLKAQGLSPTGRKRNERPVEKIFYGYGGATATLKNAADEAVGRWFEQLDFSKAEARVLAGYGSVVDLNRYASKYGIESLSKLPIMDPKVN